MNGVSRDPSAGDVLEAVSRQTASEMARGIRHFACADIGLGVTGIAGPGGGTKAKPVGRVHMALSYGKTIKTARFIFKGSRRDIKFQASQAALDMIRRSVK